MAFPIPANLWTHWNLDPVILLLAVALYIRGFVRLWRRRGVARGIHVWQAIAFFTGILLLLVTMISPLDRLTLALLWVHPRLTNLGGENCWPYRCVTLRR